MPGYGARQKGSSCFSATPWLALLCGLIALASIPVWYIFSTAAAGNTQQALQDTNITAAADVVGEVITAFYTLRTVVLVLLAVCLGLLMLTAVLEIISKMRQHRRGAQCGYSAFSGLGTALLWLTLIGVVALVAVCTTWLVGAWAGSALLSQASNISTSAEEAAQRAVNSAQQLVSDLKASQLDILDSAPGDIKNSDWFRDYYKGVQDINATSLLPNNLQASSSNATVCQPGCISLDVLAGLAGMENGCLCLTNTLQGLQTGLARTRENMLPAVIGVAVCYLAASLLLIYFAHTHSTANHLRRASKAAADPGLGLTTQYGNGHIPGYPISNGAIYRGPADAAVDIHGTTNGLSQQKHAIPGLIETRGGHPLRGLGFNSNDGSGFSNGVGTPTEQDVLRARDGFNVPPMSDLFGPSRPAVPAGADSDTAVEVAVHDGRGITPGRYSTAVQPPVQQRL